MAERRSPHSEQERIVFDAKYSGVTPNLLRRLDAPPDYCLQTYIFRTTHTKSGHRLEIKIHTDNDGTADDMTRDKVAREKHPAISFSFSAPVRKDNDASLATAKEIAGQLWQLLGIEGEPQFLVRTEPHRLNSGKVFSRATIQIPPNSLIAHSLGNSRIAALVGTALPGNGFAPPENCTAIYCGLTPEEMEIIDTSFPVEKVTASPKVRRRKS